MDREAASQGRIGQTLDRHGGAGALVQDAPFRVSVDQAFRKID